MRAAAIILAAGRSNRFGTDNKLQADLGGRTLLAHVLALVRGAQLAPVIVRGPADILPDDPEAISVLAPDCELGMAHSLAAGIRAIDASYDAAFLFFADMPFIAPSLIPALLAALPGHDAALPVWQGRFGHPALFHQRVFARLGTLTGDQGARSLLGELTVAHIASPDDGILFDIDTPADLAAARDRYARA
jgi:molybdenum cofactor cytidylyltransferase